MKFGKAFSDNLLEEKRREKMFDVPSSSWWLGFGRTLFVITIFVICMFILLWRLFSLTVVSGHTYRKLADENRIRELVIHAPRGEILDRTGKKLVFNVPHFRLLKPCDDDPQRQCTTKISEEEGNSLKTKGLPSGWFLETDWRRGYGISESIAHVAGYVGEISPEELKDEYYALRLYRPGDLIGRLGAEATFEEKLKGRDGKELVEVDARGGILRTLGHDAEVAGETVTLSLDSRLSEAVANVFPNDSNGAVIVSKPQTGEILALYSRPSFSPVLFSNGLTEREYEALVTDPDKPLFNRAIGGVYPPGSTFKLVTAIAGLEEGAIKKDTIIEDVGEITIGSYKFPNWFFLQYGKTDGAVDVVKALQRSNDIFFYKAGEFLGITKLASWARKFGIGKPLGIELSGEAGGLMPDPSWKNEQFTSPEDLAARNNDWYLGDTYHVAIGQGYLLTTPLQVNTWTNVVANGGKLCKPTILKMQNAEFIMQNCKDLKIKKENIGLVLKGMEQACDTGGTGYPFFNFGIRKMKSETGEERVSTNSGTFTKIPVACKTGTAEFGLATDKTTHAWFTAFAPVPSGTGQAPSGDNQILTGEPEISVTVLLEGAGQGSDKAAPIAKKIMEEWFSR